MYGFFVASSVLVLNTWLEQHVEGRSHSRISEEMVMICYIFGVLLRFLYVSKYNKLPRMCIKCPCIKECV